MKIKILFLTAIFALVAGAIISFAEVDTVDTVGNRVMEGSAKAVYGDFITIVPYAAEVKSNDANPSLIGDQSFAVDNQTRYGKNLSRVSDIKFGDQLRISYHKEADQNVANLITKIEPDEKIRVERGIVTDRVVVDEPADGVTTTTTTTTTTAP
jgi:hypothetical protein